MCRHMILFLNTIIIWCSVSANGYQDGCSNSSNLILASSSWRGMPSESGNHSCQPKLKSSIEPAEVMSYSSMPELFGLDHYEQCLSRPGGAYCLLQLDLANVPGQLYDYIMEYSSVTKKHYYRARLHRGVCISERCGLTCAAAARGPELLACLNSTVFQESGVQVGQVKINYCNSADHELPAPDSLDQTFAVILAVVVVLVASGTAHHLMLLAGWVDENQYAMAFSIVRNWQILKSGSSTDESDTFRSLQGMRFFTMLMIIAAHGFVIMAHGFISNPEFIEQTYDDPLKLLVLNGRVIVQTFFVMSGFLLTHYSLKDIDRKPIKLSMLPNAMLNRCMRLLPCVLVSVGLMATWVPRLGGGPLWGLLVRDEQNICRTGWWRQLLFIQNYFSFDKVCLPQTWYLAADTQLYALGFLLMVMLSRYRQHGWLLFSAVLSVSLVVPALQTYLQNMMPIRASLNPESFLKLFVDNKTFINAYMSAQANWTGYTLGMFTAYVHYQAKKNSWDLSNSVVLKWLYYCSLPMAICAVWFGAEFHTRPASRVEAALFNALDHNVFAAAMCLFIMGCIYKCDGVLRSCVEWAPLQSLGRLSFCALLLHTPVLRTYIGHLPGLLHCSVYNIVFVTLGATVLTFVFSLMMFLLVEQPSCQLQKIMIGSNKKSSKIQSAEHCQREKIY